MLNVGKVKATDWNQKTHTHTLHTHYRCSPSVQTQHTVEYEGEPVSAVYRTQMKARLKICPQFEVWM